MNNFSCVGKLGADSTLAKAGNADVLNFTLADDQGFGDKKTTNWIACSLWGTRAPKLQQYLKKGTDAFVTGEIKAELYQKRDGTAGVKMILKVNQVKPILHGQQQSQPQQQGYQQQYPQNNPAPQQQPQQQVPLDDIPF